MERRAAHLADDAGDTKSHSLKEGGTRQTMIEFHKKQDAFVYPLSASFIFGKGEHKGERYRVRPRVCENPLCSCQDVEFVLEAVDDGNRYEFSLDIEERRLTRQKDRALSAPNANFARSFLKELDSKQWNEIQISFFSAKAHIVKNCDIEQLDPEFPMEEIESDGTMVSWHEIFPYAADIVAKDDAAEYVFDDQYCISSTCSCKNVVLAIIAIENGEALNDDSPPVVRYSYGTRKWTVEPSTDDGSLSVEKIMSLLLRSLPDLPERLKERHRIMRRLYGKYRRKHGFVEAVQPTPKIGRNDPCPCGSGKKYKKCCGQ